MKRTVNVKRHSNKTIVVYHYGRKIDQFRLSVVDRWNFHKIVTIPLVLLIIASALLSIVLDHFQPKISEAAEPKIVKIIDKSIPPILEKIALCESSGRHLDKNNKVLRGKQNSDDLGKWQINEKIWGKKSQELGYNIKTAQGNENMAKWLFENYGSVPWRNSSPCWLKK